MWDFFLPFTVPNGYVAIYHQKMMWIVVAYKLLAINVTSFKDLN